MTDEQQPESDTEDAVHVPDAPTEPPAAPPEPPEPIEAATPAPAEPIAVASTEPDAKTPEKILGDVLSRASSALEPVTTVEVDAERASMRAEVEAEVKAQLQSELDAYLRDTLARQGQSAFPRVEYLWCNRCNRTVESTSQAVSADAPMIAQCHGELAELPANVTERLNRCERVVAFSSAPDLEALGIEPQPQ